MPDLLYGSRRGTLDHPAAGLAGVSSIPVCSATGRPDGAPAAAESCPGQAVTLWPGDSLVLAGTTDGFADNFQPSCWKSTGPDRVYAVQPGADGFVIVPAQSEGYGPGTPVLVYLYE